MKKSNLKLPILLFVSMISLCACTKKKSLEIIDAKVEIITDDSITGSMVLQQGKDAGKNITPTALYYCITIKNTGNLEIGSEDKGLTVQIIPNKALIKASEDVMGFNIFVPYEYRESGLGYGYSLDPVIDIDKIKEFTIYFELGYQKKTIEAKQVPSKKQLEYLKENAFDATVVFYEDEKELTRINLQEYKER